jgi:hypothetical protein
MSSIKDTHGSCGEVEMTENDIALMVCSHAPLSYYRFLCPKCQENVQKPATDEIIRLLMSGGVRPTVWEVPPEAFEHHYGEPLTEDEYLDFKLAIADEDLLAALIGV